MLKIYSTEEKVKVMLAYLNGDEIEATQRGFHNWCTLNQKPKWDWNLYEYRAKRKNLYFNEFDNIPQHLSISNIATICCIDKFENFYSSIAQEYRQHLMQLLYNCNKLLTKDIKLE